MTTTQQVLQTTEDLLTRAKREGITEGGILTRTPEQVKSIISSFPTSADQIKNTGGDFTLPKIDTTTPDLSGVSGMISFYQKQYEITQKQQEDYKKQLETTQKKQETETKSWLDKIKGALSPTEKRTKVLEETGFKVPEYFAERQADISELETLNKEYNSAVAQRDQQIADVMGRPGQSMDFLNNQVAQIDRNSAVRLNQMAANINSKAAIIEAKQGRYNEAMNYVNQAVENATSDLKYNYDMFKAFYDLNQDKIEALDTKLQDAYKDSITSAKSVLDTARDEKWKELNYELDKYKAEKVGTGTDPVLEAIRLMTLQNLQGQFQVSPGQLYYKATGKAATDLPVTFIERLSVLNNFSQRAKSIVPQIEYYLQQPDVDISKMGGALKQFGYQGFGRYLGMAENLTENEKSLFDYMSQLSNEYLYARSGAQINEQENKRLKQAMPKAGLSNEDNLRVLENFSNTINSLIKSRLDIYGVDFYGNNIEEEVDYEKEWEENFGKQNKSSTFKSYLPKEIEEDILPSWLR